MKLTTDRDFEIWGCSHCTSCQKLSGGEFTMNQVVPKDDINITKGTLKTYTYKGDSGNDVHCYYCPNCTSHIYRHMEMMGPMYVARTGLLDGGNDFNVEVELYGKDRLHWMPELAKTFEMGPS